MKIFLYIKIWTQDPRNTKQVYFNSTATLGSNCGHLMNGNRALGCTAVESWFDSVKGKETHLSPASYLVGTGSSFPGVKKVWD